jgi:hypothetical protein
VRMDNTRIAVRERGILEILDLSLHLLRHYAKPLAITLAMGIVPCMLLNHLLIGSMTDVAWEGEGFPFRYIWNMLVLVFLEAPLASVFATTYLGMSVFYDKPSIWRVAQDVLRYSPRLAFTQLLIRGIGPAWLLYLAVPRDSDYSPLADTFVSLLAVYAWFLRAARPFINEVVLLEKNPLRAQSHSTMTIGRRSALLHGPSSAELFGRSLLSTLMAVLMFGAFYATFHLLSSAFLGDPTQGPLMVELVMPLTMWLIAGYFTVVRFLGYLDLRIRQEGWEVELRLRSEAAILQSKMT